MFRTPSALVAATLLGQLAAAAAGDAETCDATSGDCSSEAGDSMSAMQLRGQPTSPWSQDQQEEDKEKQQYASTGKWPGYGKYWVLINSSNISKALPYSKTGDKSGIPSCFQGLFYMDQQCLTWPNMSKSNVKKPCLGRKYPYQWVNEYVTAFGNWDGRKRCFTAERKAWTFGQADISSYVCSGYGIRACQTNANTKGPCDTGAEYATTNLGSGFYWTWYFVKNSEKNGWTRKTPYGMPPYTYYPVHQVVDGNGQQTKWWPAYEQTVTQTKCPWGSPYTGPKGCRKSQWAKTGQIANCIRGTINR